MVLSSKMISSQKGRNSYTAVPAATIVFFKWKERIVSRTEKIKIVQANFHPFLSLAGCFEGKHGGWGLCALLKQPGKLDIINGFLLPSARTWLNAVYRKLVWILALNPCVKGAQLS